MGFEPCDFRCWEAVGETCHCSCGGINHGILKRNKNLIPFKDLYPQRIINKKPYTLIKFANIFNYHKEINKGVIAKKLSLKEIRKYKPAYEMFKNASCYGEKAIYGIYQEINLKDKEFNIKKSKGGVKK